MEICCSERQKKKKKIHWVPTESIHYTSAALLYVFGCVSLSVKVRVSEYVVSKDEFCCYCIIVFSKSKEERGRKESTIIGTK